MDRKKILWLVSWYPHKSDPYDGDFIQRHARAAAIFHDIDVIFVTDAPIGRPVEKERHQATGLTEQLIYFQKPAGLLGRVRKQWLWRRHAQQAIKAYIRMQGLPAGVHVHVPWKAGLLALWMKKKYRTPFLVTEHWGLYDGAQPDTLANRPAWMRQWLTRIYREAEGFVAVSRYLAAGVERLTGRKAVMLLPNVVDTTLFFYREEKYSKFTFLHVSNMMPVKNIAGLLEAFAAFLETGEDAQLILVGNRDQHFAEQAAQMGLLHRSVFFRGEISYAEVAEEMRRAHALVIFSDSETFSCVTAEALCCGLPVVATDTGALPELVHAANGLLVPPRNVAALAGAMHGLRAHYASYNPARIAGEAARQYGYAPVAAAFDQLYRTQF